jgi:hypothetical protein
MLPAPHSPSRSHSRAMWLPNTTTSFANNRIARDLRLSNAIVPVFSTCMCRLVAHNCIEEEFILDILHAKGQRNIENLFAMPSTPANASKPSERDRCQMMEGCASESKFYAITWIHLKSTCTLSSRRARIYSTTKQSNQPGSCCQMFKCH